ncbi:MAG: hypothetical protein LBR37_00095, partial [Erysipelotrichaceae bacterium]|nr:hypothetical protein [Erysipelotrichaceae bacterium]
MKAKHLVLLPLSALLLIGCQKTPPVAPGEVYREILLNNAEEPTLHQNYGAVISENFPAGIRFSTDLHNGYAILQDSATSAYTLVDLNTVSVVFNFLNWTTVSG